MNEITQNDKDKSSSQAIAPPPKPAEARLTDNANDFLIKLDALLETVNRIMFIMLKSRKRAREELTTYVDSLQKTIDGKVAPLSYGSAEMREFLKRKKALNRAIEAQRIVPQSFLVSMVSQYDAFLVGVIRNLFLLKPEKIRTAEKTISVKDLVKCSSIDEVLNDLIEAEIDEILRGSHLSQLQWVAKKFDFTIDPKDSLIGRFIEITERRNLYVHAEGVVSKQYIDYTKDVDSSPVPQIGQQLSINRAYMQHARDTLFETGIRTSQIAWRKIRPDQCQDQDGLLITIIFELLAAEEFSLARSISDFASSLRDISSETNKRIICINRAQAYKWSGKNDEAKELVNKLAWDASSAHLRLAVAVINDDYETVSRLMKVVPIEGKDGIEPSSYRLWPLFREIRNVQSFQDAFQSKFGEPLEKKSFEISQETTKDPATEEEDGVMAVKKTEVIH